MIAHVFRQRGPARCAVSRSSGRRLQSDGLDLMDAVEQGLKAAVERQYGGTACLAYIDAVSVRPPGQPVWEGIILVFDLDSQVEAERAYAWFAQACGNGERRFHLVLHGPLVQSGDDAVMAVLPDPARSPDPPSARMPA